MHTFCKSFLIKDLRYNARLTTSRKSLVHRLLRNVVALALPPDPVHPPLPPGTSPSWSSVSSTDCGCFFSSSLFASLWSCTLLGHGWTLRKQEIGWVFPAGDHVGRFLM